MTYASDLASLVDAYAEAKEAEAAAQDRVKDLRDSLLVAYSERDLSRNEDQGNVLEGTRSVVTISQTKSMRLDTASLKADHPTLFAAYAKQSSSTRLTVIPR